MIALLIVLACGSAPPPGATPIALRSPESVQIEAVIRAWNERDDLPPLDAARLRALLVLDARTEAEYLEWCPPSNECLAHRGSGLTRPMTAIVVIAPGREAGTRLSLIRHGAVHRAAEVAGIGMPDHSDRRLWPYFCSPSPRPPNHVPTAAEIACRAATVEERARTIANGGN